jgi:hypothetical protein
MRLLASTIIFLPVPGYLDIRRNPPHPPVNTCSQREHSSDRFCLSRSWQEDSVRVPQTHRVGCLLLRSSSVTSRDFCVPLRCDRCFCGDLPSPVWKNLRTQNCGLLELPRVGSQDECISQGHPHEWNYAHFSRGWCCHRDVRISHNNKSSSKTKRPPENHASSGQISFCCRIASMPRN